LKKARFLRSAAIPGESITLLIRLSAELKAATDVGQG